MLLFPHRFACLILVPMLGERITFSFTILASELLASGLLPLSTRHDRQWERNLSFYIFILFGFCCILWQNKELDLVVRELVGMDVPPG